MKKIIIILIVIAVIVSIVINVTGSDNDYSNGIVPSADYVEYEEYAEGVDTFDDTSGISPDVDYGPLCADLGGEYLAEGNTQACTFETESQAEFYCDLVAEGIANGVPGSSIHGGARCTYIGA